MAGTFHTRGQPTALAFVKRAVASVRPPHALLLSGPPRVGKTTLLLDLAAGLLCLAEQPVDRPCRACLACRKVEAATHPDVHRLAPEGAGGQVMNPDAQNALLKLLEEPPAQVTIALAADEPAGLLPTVISRCARVRLGPVAPAAIAQILAQRAGMDIARGESIGRQSAGQVGLALELAARPELLIARGRLARSLLDLLDADRRTRLGAAGQLIADGAEIAAGATAEASSAVEDEEAPKALGVRTSSRGRGGRGVAKPAPAERRAAVAHVLDTWRELARDLALASRGGAAELRGRDLIDELAAAGKRTDGPQMVRFVERLEGASRALDAYANPELVLDVLLVEWPRANAQAGSSQAA